VLRHFTSNEMDELLPTPRQKTDVVAMQANSLHDGKFGRQSFFGNNRATAGLHKNVLRQANAQALAVYRRTRPRVPVRCRIKSSSTKARSCSLGRVPHVLYPATDAMANQE
jgi:hypothetical protein